MTTEKKSAKPRLYFIDFARSIAIIMMLEGHFTGAALANQYRDGSNWLYALWHNLHGLTSPLFFTTSGLIFVYLLTGTKADQRYFENERVRKGFKRVLELLFWGYTIQLSFHTIGKDIYYGSEWHLDWVYAFHVLQSIGIGIFLLLVLFGVKKIIKVGAMHWYYLLSALVILIAYAYLKDYIQTDEASVAKGNAPSYWPHGFPKFIQNMFYGPFSDFGILRYSSYVLLGGVIGSVVRSYEHHSKKAWFSISFILLGLCFNLFTQSVLHSLDGTIESVGILKHSVLELDTTHFARFGQVLMVLGSLMFLDSRVNINFPRFLKMGQNTFPIYVIHVIILYGGIFGFGLVPYAFNRTLDPMSSAGVSVLAILFFFIMTQYIEPLSTLYNRILIGLKIKKSPPTS
jgi:hypothetical protein